MKDCNKGVQVIRVKDTCGGTKTVTDCVIHEEPITYLDLPKDSDLTLVINRLLVSLSDARDRINNLEYKINKTPNQEVQINIEDMPSGFAWRVGEGSDYIDETKHFHLAYLTVGQLRSLVEKDSDQGGVFGRVDRIDIETPEREGHKHTLTVKLFGSKLIVINVTSTSGHEHRAFPLSNTDLSAFPTFVQLDQVMSSFIENQKLTQRVININENDLTGYNGTLEENIAAHVTSLGINKKALEDVSIEYSYEEKLDLVITLSTLNLPDFNILYLDDKKVYSPFPYNEWFYDASKTVKANDTNSDFGALIRESLADSLRVDVSYDETNYFEGRAKAKFVKQQNGEYLLEIKKGDFELPT